jgi:putative ABC transport system permease protein
MAVGASPALAVRLIMGASLGVVLAGTAAGLVAAFLAARAVRPFLYGVSSHDPATYAAIVSLIVAVAGVATWIPARRLARIDLMRTLSAD